MEIWLFIGGYSIHLVASLLLIWKIHKSKSVYGLSFDTQVCYLLACISRCIWSVNTRLVETYAAYLELAASTIAAVVLCYLCHRYRHTTTHQAWKGVSCWMLVPVTLVVAMLFHPGMAWWSSQILVAFTMYIEAVALLPQQYLMRRMKEIEPITSHYVGFLILSRILRLVFWGWLYMQGLLKDIIYICKIYYIK
eukprot:GHVL01005520.1.p1 GENE.GHVL01005520.1~~GHVL01005520.1.p1  ORF type:complete len:194 (+),score=13.71 GHVL01005520.1:18-599(+)